MASGKTLQSTIEISGVLSPSLQAAINSAVDRLADMAEETLDSADAASRLVAEMSAQEDILKTMQKAYAGYVASGEEGSDQAQELAGRIRTVSGELEENRDTLEAAERAAKQLTDKLENTDDGFDEMGDAAEQAGNDVENSSEGYTVLKDAIGDLVADGIEAAVEAFKELATEGDSALGMLEARTGASAAKMEGFEDVMYEVYNANYGESLGAVSETLSTVIQMTDDLDNASLAQITKNSITLSDVFGFDTMESLRAVNSLMDQFGITSDQAYNLIVQGAQNGLNQNDDLLDTINEYSVQFKNAGYTADDMFNMLANGAESGTWSVDKLGDAVKEFNIRMSDGTANDYLEQLGVDVDAVMEKFNKGGPEAQEAIDTVMQAINDCDDATLQYQAGVGLFGTMWEDLGADAVFSLMETEGAIDSATDAMGKMDEAAHDTLESSLSQLGRTIKAEVVQPIADKLVPVIKKAVDFTTSKVAPAVDWILDHLPEIGMALGAVGAVIAAMKWSSIVSGVGKAVSAFKGIGTALSAIPGPVLVIIGIVAALAAAFVYLWKNNEDFRDKVTAIWEQLKGSFSELGGTITGLIEQLMPVLSSLATSLMTAFVEIAEALIPVLLELISSVLVVVIDLLVQLLPLIMDIVMAVLPVAVQLIQSLLPIIVQIVQAVLPILVQLMQTLLPVIMQIVQAVLPVLVQLIETLLPIVMQIVQMVLPVLVQMIQTLVPMYLQIIQAVLPVLIQLINTLLPVIMQIVQAVLPILVQLIQTLLPVIMQIIQAVLPVLLQLIQTLVPIALQIIQAVLPVLIQLINTLLPIIMQIITAVLPVLVQILNLLTPILNLVIMLLQPILDLIVALVMPILNLIMTAITPLIEIFLNLIMSVLQPIMPIITALAEVITSVLGSAIQGIQPIIQALTSVFQGLIDFITGVFSGNWSQAWNGIVEVFGGLWDGLVAIVKAPINGVIGLINGAIGALNKISVKIPDWVPVVGGQNFGINIPTIPMLAAGGFTDGVSIAGEEAMEAVISFDPAYRDKNIGIWERAGQLLGVLGNENHGAGLTSKAGELLTLDNFSLGSLADGTNVVIYYDFSGFTWSPQIQASGTGDSEDNLMARLRAHEAEFFDWLEEFIQMREVALYGA